MFRTSYPAGFSAVYVLVFTVSLNV